MMKQSVLRTIIFTLGLASAAFAAAQVMVMPSPPSTTVLREVAGDISSITLNAPDDVKTLYVTAQYQGENITLNATDAPAGGEFILTSGILDVVLHSCRDGVVLFSGTEQGNANTLTRVCVPFEDFAGGSSTLGAGDHSIFIGTAPTEVQVNEWVPFLVYEPRRTTQRFRRERLEPQETFVFLLYLSSEPLPADEDAYPQPPILSTWDDLPQQRP